MLLDDALKKISVIGAAGKMGKGLSLLLVQEVARTEVEKYGNLGTGNYRINLIDIDDKALSDLKTFLYPQLTRFAEKNINVLRKNFENNPEMISNEKMINSFVDGALENIRLYNNLDTAKDSFLIFESVQEGVEDKVNVLKQIKNPNSYYFSNTSSIPISILNEDAGMNNRIIGFHFFNPPHIQKLIEIIPPSGVVSNLLTLATELSQRLKKIAVFSNDITGFIGNGFFMKDTDAACDFAEDLNDDIPLSQAIWMVDTVTREYLFRPMGNFQLVDYVGIDICEKISHIMGHYMPNVYETVFQEDILEEMYSKKIYGGINTDGTQKPGFFEYEKNIPVSVIDLNTNKYIPIDQEWRQALGEKPEGIIPWREMKNDPNKAKKFERFYTQLLDNHTLGAQIAKNQLFMMIEISLGLVNDNIAKNMKDVSTVLKEGFSHLYGPDDAWIPDETVLFKELE